MSKNQPLAHISIPKNVYPFVLDFMNSEQELSIMIEPGNKVSQLSLINAIRFMSKKERNEEDPRQDFVLRGEILLFFTKIFEIISEKNPAVSIDEIYAVQFIPFDLIMGYIDYCFSDSSYKRGGFNGKRTSWTNSKIPIYLQ